VNVLLDTNALLWWLTDNPRLHDAARDVIANPSNVVYVSAASAWEIAIKVGLGRLAAPLDVAAWLPASLRENRFTPLPINIEHAAAVEALPPHHADPFDRLLIAQARAEDLWLMTASPVVQRYDVRLIRCDVDMPGSGG
jgi:PIN domain nuclease of toxin-antitoxin system